MAHVVDRAIAHASILTLLTCRPEFQPPWEGKSQLTPLTLQRLTRVQIEAMVARITGGKTLPGDVLQHLVEKSDGVPLYVEEMTKAILESGVLKASNGHYTLSAPLTALAIPSTLQDSLMARLDRLGEAKGIAQLGATLGRQFAYAVLQAVAQADEAAVQQALRHLVEAGLVYQRGVLPEATYTFKHALIQDIAYQSLLKSVRQQHHQRITEVLEARFPEIVASQPALLAHHAAHGEVWDKAFTYLRQAGTTAMQQSAYQEAVVCFDEALGALQYLPESSDTLAQAIDLRFDLRSALLPIWEHDRILAIMREAEAIAEALGDAHRLGRATANLTHALWLTADLEQAFTTGQRAVALTASLNNAGLRGWGRFSLGNVYFSLGQYAPAIEGYRQNVDEFVSERAQTTNSLSPWSVTNLRWLAQSLAEIGMFAEAKAWGEESIRAAEAMRQPYMLSNGYAGAGYVSLCHGDIPKAMTYYARGVEICERWGILQILHGPAIGLSMALALSRQAAEAVTLLERAVGQPPPLSLLISRMPELPRLGEIYLLADRLEEAAYYAEQALAFARAHHERGREAYALHLLGEIIARHDPHALAHAVSHSQQALALATELGMRPMQAHCHHSLGTLYRQMNRAEEARAALSTAIDLYREMDMAFWLPEAEAALEVSSL